MFSICSELKSLCWTLFRPKRLIGRGKILHDYIGEGCKTRENLCAISSTLQLSGVRLKYNLMRRRRRDVIWSTVSL